MMQMLGFRGGAGAGASKSPGGAAGSASPASPSSSPVAVGPGRPLRLVYCDDKGKFRMDPEAVATLQLVKGPIGVVSVCGRARQGKSFILNQLLGRSSGFLVASTHRPCTKGLWMWSTPIKRTALDGTEYYLLLLDSEGIDAYDQTGTYSTQIFSLAVLLSSLFIYNQMGGIDEAALDRLSLVTEMTKHIRVRAAGGRTSTSELGQFSPVFVWLLRDFYLDLAEDNRKITPRDYLELALRPMHVGGKATTGKNEIRESIRALFPDRECFTLVRPLSNESDLQRLDQISLNRLRPEFRSGLDELTRFVFERTKPKQVGSTVMTGPILAGIAQSFIDAINNGAVPTITSSWQSVEESECQRAYDIATEAYMSAFDRTKPPDEVLLRDAHEEAVHKSLSLFNDNAVGMGAARQKYEKLLRTFWKKAFEDYKRHVFMESDFACSNAIQIMEKKLRETCNSPNVTLDGLVKVLKSLLAEYEKSTHGPAKWQKVANFLHQSLEGPVLDLAKKQLDQIASEKSALMLKYRSNEDKVELLNKQLVASEKYKSDYMRHYEEAINDKKKVADEYAIRLSNLQSNCSSLEERCSSLSKTLNAARNESLEWKRKYELGISQQKSSEDQVKAELAVLKSRNSAIDARLAAASEKAASALEEAAEWKRNFETAVKETKAALEKAANIQEKTNKQAQQRETALREQFSNSIAEKESVIKEKQEKVDQMEQHLASLRSELKISESKVKSYEIEYSTLKSEIRELNEKLDSAKASAQSYEKEASMLKQEKINLEGKYVAEFRRFEEAGERCASAEKEAKIARELADNALAEAAITQKEKSEVQRAAMERLAQIERTERHVESLERQKADLLEEIQRLRLLVSDANSKVSLLETQLDDRQREIAELLNSTNEQRASTVQVLDNLLDSERFARAEAEKRAEALSLQLRSTQAKLDALQQELTSVRVHETALDSKLKTSSRGKRSRIDEQLGIESVQDMEIDEQHATRGKKSRSATSPLKTPTQDGGSVFRGEFKDNQSSHQGEVEDYTKFTVAKLKQELTRHGFGLQLLELKSPNKKDILAVYERTVLKK